MLRFAPDMNVGWVPWGQKPTEYQMRSGTFRRSLNLEHGDVMVTGRSLEVSIHRTTVRLNPKIGRWKDKYIFMEVEKNKGLLAPPFLVNLLE